MRSKYKRPWWKRLWRKIWRRKKVESPLVEEKWEFYDARLIESVSLNLVHDQFSQRRPLQHESEKVIEFRAFSPLEEHAKQEEENEK